MNPKDMTDDMLMLSLEKLIVTLRNRAIHQDQGDSQVQLINKLQEYVDVLKVRV